MLLERLHRHDADISKTIAEVIQHWERQRVARIDDCIIRLGACELIACPDIPAAVSINEAIELAKKYSTEHSGRFVNGILDAMAAHYLTAEVEK
jgi:N utilization substance protein B